MDFRLSPAHEAIRAKARGFALREIAPAAPRLDLNDEFSRDIMARLGREGFLGMVTPEEYGGAGLDTLSYAIAVEEFSRVCGGIGLSVAAHNSLAQAHILAFASDEQKRRYLPPIARGDELGAWALTEPNSGSDAGGMQTTAKRDGDHYILHGSKTFITTAAEASTFVVITVTDRTKGGRGMTAFIVERGTPGFGVSGRFEKLGVRASLTSELHFDSCRVPAANIIGKEGEGFVQALKNLDGGRVSIGAMALGLAQGSLDSALWYFREGPGKGKGAGQAVAFSLASLSAKVEAARLLVYRAAVMKTEGVRFTRESAEAKLYASEAATEAGIVAVRLIGADALRHCGLPPERLLRDAKLCEIGEGTSEVQRLVIARQLGLGS